LSRKTTSSKNGELLKKGKAIYGIGKKRGSDIASDPLLYFSKNLDKQ